MPGLQHVVSVHNINANIPKDVEKLVFQVNATLHYSSICSQVVELCKSRTLPKLPKQNTA